MNSPVIPLHKETPSSPPDDLVERVQSLSNEDTLNIWMEEPHFRDQMVKRGIDMRSVLEVLRHGRLVGNPKLDEYGDWRIEMRRKVAGRRIHVVVAVCAKHVRCITTWAAGTHQRRVDHE